MFAILLLTLPTSLAGDCAVHCTDLGDCLKQCAGDAEPKSCINPVFDENGNAVDCTVPPLPMIDSTRGPSVSTLAGEHCAPSGPRTQVIINGDPRCRANDLMLQQALYWSEPMLCKVLNNGEVLSSYVGPPRLTFIDCYSP